MSRFSIQCLLLWTCCWMLSWSFLWNHPSLRFLILYLAHQASFVCRFLLHLLWGKLGSLWSYCWSPWPCLLRSKKMDLTYFIFSFIFSFWFIFQFSIFRTTRVRVDWSCHHISHLMAKSQDRSQDLEKFSRRFENKWCYTIWTPHGCLE